jgi:ATP-dependent Lon protease
MAEAQEQTNIIQEENPIPEIIPLMPIREAVYFPHAIFPIFVGRDKSVRALEEARCQDRYILLVAQRQNVDDPQPEDLYDIGVVAEIMQVLNLPDNTVRVMLEGTSRVRIMEYLQSDPFFRVRIEPLAEEDEKSVEAEALMRSVVTQFQQVVELGKNVPPESLIQVMNIDEPGRLADTIVPFLPLKVEAKQEILETLGARERLEKLSVILKKETEILEIQKNIRNKVEKEMGETQREFILREQLKAIQQELGERDERGSEIEEYRAKITEAKMPEEAEERALKELDRLEKMPFQAPEGVVVRTYLDWLVTVPWSQKSEERVDIDEAQKVLDEDHYGLSKVKERILEFLAVRKLAGKMKGPILCFVGPPGVGKTSIGKSIARALGRKFVRISLGGVRDEAEIRGHRRTYIGALPGRIIQGVRTAATNNPVFMLDEIDKLGMDFRGDPSAALLEALDPEQNNAFSDHYLEVPFDLSDVMFITTANLLDPIPPALKDRMEVITFPGYIEEEKLNIARGFLVPKQRKEHGLQDEQLTLEEIALRRLIREYTRESGVRNLEREIATICRKVAKEVASGREEPTHIGDEDVKSFLGARRYHFGVAEEKDEVGAATGLVYTEVGGDIVSVEATLMRFREGKVTLTGQLGDIMKESAMAGLSYVRSRAQVLDFDPDFFDHTEIHIHVPAGATPKDGPSAGITMATAIASALTRRPVRKDVAMTGEITLRGKVLAVGGVKEKVLAAHRAGIRTVILPQENERDLEEIPGHVREEMTFHFVAHCDEVLKLALLESGAVPAGVA